MAIYVVGSPTTPSLPMVAYDNIFAKGTLTATSATADGAAANAIVEGTYNYWIPSAMPASLQTTLGSATGADTFGVIAHNYGSVAATVNFEYWNGSAWITITTITPTDDSPIVAIFTTITATLWRIRLTGATAPATGVVYLAARLIIPGGVQAPYTPVWLAERVELMNSTSLGGKYIKNRAVRKGKETTIKLAAVTRTFAETNLNAFRIAFNNGEPFLWASGPSLFPNDVGYCWRKGGEIRPTYDQDAIWMALEMDISADASG
jgi:hypothetical protein